MFFFDIDCTSKNEVVSKYFSNGTVMDDSLSEFQAIKKFNTGPKVKRKPRNIKTSRRARGQKDIRALINKQESAVVTYTKDFDKISKQIGVDVDSEELQLAIALSKSLQGDDIISAECKNSSKVDSPQRTLNIKKTLQEYGFRQSKTTTSTKSNHKKSYRKYYKLLKISETQRQQNITDRYSEVLAKNNFRSPKKCQECKECCTSELYNIATNISYELIKNDDIFYVNGLFSKPSLRTCLLRDWSEIPGRLLSPQAAVDSVDFSDITCNESELDCILSGTIISAQQIISSKKCDSSYRNSAKVVPINLNEVMEYQKCDIDSKGIKSTSIVSNINTEKQLITNMPSLEHVRCTSPDIFDDEVSIVLEGPSSQPVDHTVINNDNSKIHYMDLTDCVKADSLSNSNINMTRKKSNDLMEMTKCVSSTKEVYNNIDLTQNLDDSNNKTIASCTQNTNIEVMDLTQIPLVHLVHVKQNPINDSLNNTIIILDEDFNNQLQEVKETTVLECSDKCLNNPNRISKETLSSKTNNKSIRNDYLTSNIIETVTLEDETNIKLLPHNQLEHNVSVIVNNGKENFDTENKQENIQNNTFNCETLHIKQSENDDILKCSSAEIDLTQSSDSSNKDVDNELIINSKLGKKDDISIDYDEIFDEIVKNNSQTSQTSTRAESYATEFICNNDDNVTNSGGSDVFNISDKEFNYSLHKSMYKDRSSTGDLDIHNIEQNNSIRNERLPSSSKKRSLSEGNICNTKMQNNDMSKSQTPILNCETPRRVLTENFRHALQSSDNDGYIIKTIDVTPMRDYASMSSPERHKELEKYGLKPFKRKRAIQLLTYLYNQTHPVVESQEEDIQSPSKRQKTDEGIGQQKLAQNICHNEPPEELIPEVHNENNLYKITQEEPVVRNIECNSEDWIFQKRERAKVHSCRVPLHIAFHNYVSCRRGLWEAILCYEPVNIDVIHKELVASGYRYNPKDLLKFMDKRCITVRTADNNSRNRKS